MTFCKLWVISGQIKVQLSNKAISYRFNPCRRLCVCINCTFSKLCRTEQTWILKKKVTEVHIFTAHTLPPYTWKLKLGADVSTQEVQRRVR